MMTPALVLIGIKSLIRVGQQTDKALIQFATDKATTLGDVAVFNETDKRVLLTQFLLLPRYRDLAKAPPFKDIWDKDIPMAGGIGDGWDGLTPDAQSATYSFAVNAARGDAEALAALGDDSLLPGQNASDALAVALIEQWKPENKPVSPFGRVALAIVEAGLGFVASDPGIFGAGKSGEKVLSAFAIALAKPLTDKLNADTLGPQAQLVNDLMTAFVGAGLETLKQHSAELISDQHLATLLGNVLDPVVAAAKDGNVLFQANFQNILSTLAVPAAQAAMKTIAENPGAFLGKNFDSAKAAGAVVSAVLIESAKNGDVSVAFGKGGALKLLTAALQVVTDKPGLFIKAGDKPDAVAALVTDLTSSFASQLKDQVLALIDDKQIDGSTLAAGIAAAAVEAFGRHGDAIIGGAGEPWHDVARKVAKSVMGNLVVAIKSPDGMALKKVLSEEKIVELGRIVVESVAANPGMTGASDAKSREIVSALAMAIGAAARDNKQLLLTPDDWLDVARTMVKEVAARPGIIAGQDAGLQAAVTAFANVIAGDKNSVLNGTDAKMVAQALLAEVAGHPAMLAGLKDDVQRIAAALAIAMAADKNLLLSGTDWVEIAKVAIGEASANPARLFGLNYNDAGQALAADMIGLVLKTLPALPAAGGGTSGLILKGDVLREGMTIIIRRVSGTPDRAKKYKPLLEAAVKEVSTFVAKNPGSFGSKEWLGLIDVLTGDVLNGRYDAELAQLAANPASIVTLIPTLKDANDTLARNT